MADHRGFLGIPDGGVNEPAEKISVAAVGTIKSQQEVELDSSGIKLSRT